MKKLTWTLIFCVALGFFLKTQVLHAFPETEYEMGNKVFPGQGNEVISQNGAKETKGIEAPSDNTGKITPQNGARETKGSGAPPDNTGKITPQNGAKETKGTEAPADKTGKITPQNGAKETKGTEAPADKTGKITPQNGAKETKGTEAPADKTGKITPQNGAKGTRGPSGEGVGGITPEGVTPEAGAPGIAGQGLQPGTLTGDIDLTPDVADAINQRVTPLLETPTGATTPTIGGQLIPSTLAPIQPLDSKRRTVEGPREVTGEILNPEPRQPLQTTPISMEEMPS